MSIHEQDNELIWEEYKLRDYRGTPKDEKWGDKLRQAERKLSELKDQLKQLHLQSHKSRDSKMTVKINKTLREFKNQQIKVNSLKQKIFQYQSNPEGIGYGDIVIVNTTSEKYGPLKGKAIVVTQPHSGDYVVVNMKDSKGGLVYHERIPLSAIEKRIPRDEKTLDDIYGDN